MTGAITFDETEEESLSIKQLIVLYDQETDKADCILISGKKVKLTCAKKKKKKNYLTISTELIVQGLESTDKPSLGIIG